ncbi:hypothetical protein BU16DRAFT_154047 [Lophium mytilinum]|uniref:C2H2-type domain-containing protein n=1 Tax=Lophium mytilinum TaxID=390894 RepID=A0A6A6QFS4_9PEZI|nr:hypothetical protein BU16DRAFT_154047 [Lophium mytilinum]
MAAAVASQHAGIWQQRRTDQGVHVPNMSMSMLPSYDTSVRTVSNPPVSRAFQPTHLDLAMPMFQSHPATSVPYQSGAFAFDPLAVNPYNMQQNFNMNYPPTLAHSVAYSGPNELSNGLPTTRDVRNDYSMMERTPPVKTEAASPIQPSQIYNDASYADDSKNTSSESDSAINFATDVDTLMKAIQAKSNQAKRQQQPSKVLPHKQPLVTYTAPVAHAPAKSSSDSDKAKSSQKSKKRYQCSMPDCHKSFYQKTHLEIHTRAHTGVKPFLCKEPSCGQRFSQLGNLKTHERRHTGERPYQCDICGKTFAQRGNVRAHKIVHQQIKPFTCRLDDCGKQFTQLGNLKSHQNKFHTSTLRYLTSKFASIREGDPVTAQDKDLWEYFAALYKNSNKGIKGRGKDRRISAAPSSAVSSSSSYSSLATASSSASHRIHHSYAHPHPASDRSSRSSSLSSEAEQEHKHSHHSYDFSGPVDAVNYSQATGYGDMVFPERKMY